MGEEAKKRLIISLDWVDIRSYKTLVAAANIKGRAVWLLWKSVPISGLNLNMSRIEEEMIYDLKGMLPAGLKVVILADRGFHKSRLFACCQKRGFDYVIRIKPEYKVDAKGFQGCLSELPVKPGYGDSGRTWYAVKGRRSRRTWWYITKRTCRRSAMSRGSWRRASWARPRRSCSYMPAHGDRRMLPRQEERQ